MNLSQLLENIRPCKKGALASLVASAWQDKQLEVCKNCDKQYGLRFFSKMAFNFLASIALIVRTAQLCLLDHDNGTIHNGHFFQKIVV